MIEDTLFGNATTEKVDLIVTELHKTPGWPVDAEKDRAYVADLIASFPALDLVEQIRGWRAWMLDHEPKRKVKPRARFRNWLRRERGDFGRTPGRSGARPGRTSTAPRPVEAFGQRESGSIGRW